MGDSVSRQVLDSVLSMALGRNLFYGQFSHEFGRGKHGFGKRLSLQGTGEQRDSVCRASHLAQGGIEVDPSSLEKELSPHMVNHGLFNPHEFIDVNKARDYSRGDPHRSTQGRKKDPVFGTVSFPFAGDFARRGKTD